MLVDGSIVDVEIYDTAGQEKYRALSDSYYAKANCCLLVYDITDRKTFEEIKEYYNPNIKSNCRKGIKVILLGNKADLEEKRQVPPEEASEFALLNNYDYMESSCVKNTNVANAFETLIEFTNRESRLNGESRINKNIKISMESYQETNNKKGENKCSC